MDWWEVECVVDRVNGKVGKLKDGYSILDEEVFIFIVKKRIRSDGLYV